MSSLCALRSIWCPSSPVVPTIRPFAQSWSSVRYHGLLQGNREKVLGQGLRSPQFSQTLRFLRTRCQHPAGHRCLFQTRFPFRRFASTNGPKGQKKPRPPNMRGFNPGGMAPPPLLPLAAGLYIGFKLLWPQNDLAMKEISYQEFLRTILPTGEVEKLQVSINRQIVFVYLHHGAIIDGKQASRFPPQYYFSVSGVNSLEDQLAIALKENNIKKESVPVFYSRETSPFFKDIVSISVAIFVAWFLLSAMKGVRMSGTPFTMAQIKPTIVKKPGPGGVRFKDVAGMTEAKEEVKEFVEYLKDPQRFVSLGARMPKGALLLGPPGTGKTLLAKAVSMEAGVPFIALAGTDFVEMVGGVGAARVRNLFSQAKNHAPCIIYIDEIDAVGRKRSGSDSQSGGGEEDQTLNQLLVEMDGMQSLKSVVVLASTNRPDILDKALLRPGRFDRKIQIDLPTLPERKDIFEVHLKKVRLKRPAEEYARRLASLTPGYSGADIANICNEAALHAARTDAKEVDTSNLEYAVERVMAGPEKRTSSIPREDRDRASCYMAGQALVSWLLEKSPLPIKVSIVPRTAKPLGFAQFSNPNLSLQTEEQLSHNLCAKLGGRAAEALIYDEITTVGQQELQAATQMAERQLEQYGMGSSMRNLSFERAGKGERRIYSDHLRKQMDEEVRRMLAVAHKKALDILKTNRAALQTLIKSLREKEVLNYQDLVELLGMPPSADQRLSNVVAKTNSGDEAVRVDKAESFDNQSQSKESSDNTEQ